MINKKEIIVSCPTCKKKLLYNPESSYRPFCSPACKDDDLIAWSDQEFKIKGQEMSDEDLQEEERKQKRNQNGS